MWAKGATINAARSQEGPARDVLGNGRLASAPATSAAAAGTSRPTVFVVHSDARVGEWVGRMGASIGWRVEAHASAEAFLRRFDPTAPGCLVVDVHLAGMSGLELQREMVTRQLVLPVVFVTTCSDVPTAVRACRQGAVDFIETPFSGERVVEAVRRAIALDRSRRAQWNGCRTLAVRAARLTRRERQVMEGVVAGKTSRAIAADLGIRLRTIEGHRARLMRKMEVDSVAVLTRLAVTLDAALASEGADDADSSPAPAAGLRNPPDYAPPGVAAASPRAPLPGPLGVALNGAGRARLSAK
jgi:FixJ family two-component response regulator